MSQWAQASRLQVVWLSVSEEDSDLDRFFRYMLAGWEQVQSGVRESPLDLLLGAKSPAP
jgi:ATP/maltotriose-dependent transcriptional regulator MalT